jgi:predicted transport protein
MPATPDQATATMIETLREKTGKSLDQWVKISRDAKLEKHGQIVSMLKSEHGLGHGYANLVAQRALQSEGAAAATDADLVDAQYAGAKSSLRPTYEKLIKSIRALGGDVEIAPKKTYVSLRRSKQFALVQPSTATRLDVGINLKNVAPTKRLEASGSFNAMVSHRVRVESADQIDAELIGWLRRAYEAA